jgi:hypothetical protein
VNDLNDVVENAVRVIMAHDPNTVGDLHRQDKDAISLYMALGMIFDRLGIKLSHEDGALALQLFRSTYYLGYKRGKAAGGDIYFLVGEEAEDQEGETL